MGSSTTNGNMSFAATSSAERLRYFLGQLLGQRELQTEQRYHVMLRRLLQREILGTGTVAGLRVTRLPSAPDDSETVIVQPGLAIDPDGRELLLERDLQIDLALPPAQTPDSGTMPPQNLPDTADHLATDISARFGISAAPITGSQVTALIDHMVSVEIIVASDIASKLAALRVLVAAIKDHQPGKVAADLPDWIFGQLTGVTCLGLRYEEKPTDSAPSVRDASCCAGVGCFPTRTLQGVSVVASSTAFPVVGDPFHAMLDAITPLPTKSAGGYDCAAIKESVCNALLDAWRSVPGVEEACTDASFPILPLASVYWSIYVPGDKRILSIDNTGKRLLAMGVPMMHAIVGGLLGCVSGGD